MWAASTLVQRAHFFQWNQEWFEEERTALALAGEGVGQVGLFSLLALVCFGWVLIILQSAVWIDVARPREEKEVSTLKDVS